MSPARRLLGPMKADLRRRRATRRNWRTRSSTRCRSAGATNDAGLADLPRSRTTGKRSRAASYGTCSIACIDGRRA
jgi:hypothetical protein